MNIASILNIVLAGILWQSCDNKTQPRAVHDCCVSCNIIQAPGSSQDRICNHFKNNRVKWELPETLIWVLFFGTLMLKACFIVFGAFSRVNWFLFVLFIPRCNPVRFYYNLQHDFALWISAISNFHFDRNGYWGKVQNMDPGSMGPLSWTSSRMDRVHQNIDHGSPIFTIPKNTEVNNNKIKII